MLKKLLILLCGGLLVVYMTACAAPQPQEKVGETDVEEEAETAEEEVDEVEEAAEAEAPTTKAEAPATNTQTAAETTTEAAEDTATE